MATATRILRERIVLIFDFDDTLGPSTTETLFERLDLDYEAFSKEVNQRQEEDYWQYALAKAEMLRIYSHKIESPVDRRAMEELAENYPLFPGADTFVRRLKQYAAGRDKDIKLEFVLLTAGFKTIPANTIIGDQFDRVYGGELIFNDEGLILGAKRVITHVDKVHYVQQLQMGLDLKDPSELEETYLDQDREDAYVPMSQIIYVGDGASDMSAFQTVEKRGGIAIAIDPDGGEEWLGYEMMSPNRRVHNVAKADYTAGSELYESLRLAVDRNIAEIQLLRHGIGE